METEVKSDIPAIPRLSNREKIIEAIGSNPNQDPCITIEGSLIQTGEPHLKLALQLIEMVLDKEIGRNADGWYVTPSEDSTPTGA